MARALLFLRNEGGFRRLCRYDLRNDEIEPARDLLAEYTWIEQPTDRAGERALRGGRLLAATSRSGSSRPISARAQPRIRARSAAETVPAAALVDAAPRLLAVRRRRDGARPLLPADAAAASRATGLPPAIVRVHGGPTASSTASYNAGGAILRDARLRGAGGEPPGQHRLRARLHAAPCATPGASPMWRIPRPARVSWPTRGWPTASGW